eukprot:sb/3477093/
MDRVGSGGSTPQLNRRGNNGNHGLDSGNQGNNGLDVCNRGNHELDSGNDGNHGLDSGNHGHSGTKDSVTPRLKCCSREFDSGKGSLPSTPQFNMTRDSGGEIMINCCRDES